MLFRSLGTNQNAATSAINVGTGATANNTVTVGTTGQTSSSILGPTVNLGTNQNAATSAINVGTSSTANNTVTVGTTGQTSSSILGPTVNLGTNQNASTSVVNVGTSSTANNTVTVGTTGQTSSSILGPTVNLGTNQNAATSAINVGTSSTANNTVTVGTTGQTSSSILGPTVNLGTNQNAATSAINVGTGATANNTVTVGTIGQTTSNILGGTVVFTNMSPTVSSTSQTTCRVNGLPLTAVIALTAETGTVAVSTTPAGWFRLPYPWRILGVRACLYTVSSSGAVTIDIRYVSTGIVIPTSVTGGTSIFTTTLTIDATKPSSVGSATPAVISSSISTNGLGDDAGLAFFVTSAGTGATGLKVILYYATV